MKIEIQNKITAPKRRLGKIMAVDFDGILVTNKWPEIGVVIDINLEFVRQMQRAGWRLILWTCRAGKQLEEAMDFCINVLRLRFDAVNENLPDIIAGFGGNPRKIYADIYLDDKSLSDSDVFDKFWSRTNANITKLVRGEQ